MPTSARRRPIIRRAAASIAAPLLAVALLASPGAVSDAAADAGSRSEAIAEALSRSGGGKVLGVKETTGSDGRREYAVKVLTDGRVRIVRGRGR